MDKITILNEEVEVPTLDQLVNMLRDLEKKYGSKLYSNQNNIRLAFLHKQETDMMKLFGAYNKKQNGIYSAYGALLDLGHTPRAMMTFPEAKDIVIEAVQLSHLETAGNPSRLNTFITQHRPEAYKAFRFLANQGKGTVWNLLKQYRPEVFSILERQPFAHSFTDKKLTAHYSRRFFAERPILLRSEKTSESLRVDRHVGQSSLKKEQRLHLRTKSGIDSVDKATQKVVHYLQKNPLLANIQAKDIMRNSRTHNKLIGSLAEVEGEILFSSYKNNPDLFKNSSLEFLVGKEIKEIFTTRDRKKISLAPINLFSREADLRLVVGNGEEEHILIDIKSYSHVRKGVLDDMLDYSNYSHWQDGTPIAKKILVFNSLTYNMDEVKTKLEERGLYVITGSEFDTLYKRFLGTLPSSFNKKVKIPLAGSRREILSKLYRSHELISKKSSFLAQFNSSYLLTYLKDFTTSLRDYSRGVYPLVIAKERNMFISMPKEVIVPLSDIFKQYNRNVDMYYIEQTMANNLYVDLETADVGRAAPIYLTGLAYTHETKGPIAHILVSRDPLEEKQMLKKYASIAHKLKQRAGKSHSSQLSLVSPRVQDGDDLTHYDLDGNGLVIDFNGNSFDQKVLYKRFMANRLPYTIDARHVDLIYPWRLWGDELPNQKLQTYERVMFGSSIRHGDIPGSEIPQVYYDGIRGGSPQRLDKIIKHNLPDLATMVLLHADLKIEGILDREITPTMIEDLNSEVYGATDSSTVPF